MIINKLDNDYLIKIYKSSIDNINIYDIDDIYTLVKLIIKKIIKNNSLSGNYQVNIYINDIYGMIIEFNKLEDNHYIDIKINIYIDSIFLYESDINYLDNYNDNIYYYLNKYYLLPKNNNINLLEVDNIIYGEKVYDILNKGIKIK